MSGTNWVLDKGRYISVRNSFSTYGKCDKCDSTMCLFEAYKIHLIDMFEVFMGTGNFPWGNLEIPSCHPTKGYLGNTTKF